MTSQIISQCLVILAENVTEATIDAIDHLLFSWSSTLTSFNFKIVIRQDNAELFPISKMLANLSNLKRFSLDSNRPMSNPHLAAPVLSHLETFLHEGHGNLQIVRHLGPNCTKLWLRYLFFMDDMIDFVEGNESLAKTVTDLVVGLVPQIEVLQLLCDHFIFLKEVRIIYKHQHDEQHPIPLLNGEVMRQLAKLVHLHHLFICNISIDSEQISPQYALNSVEILQLGGVHFLKEDSVFDLEAFGKAYAPIFPNVRKLVVHSRKGLFLKFSKEEIEKQMKQFGKLKEYELE